MGVLYNTDTANKCNQYKNMQKIKICHIITKSNWGGAQKYVFEIANSLDRNTFDITVALGGNGILKEKLESAGIEVITIPNLERDISFSKELSAFWFLYKLFKKRNFDIVHLNSSKIGGLGSLAARLSGTPKIIFTAHGWAFNEDRSPAAKILIKFLYWLTILFADKTIAVSNQLLKQVSGWPFVSKKIEVISNGVKEIDFYEKSEARQKLFEINQKLNAEKFLVGTIAELHPIKGLDILINAIKKTESEIDAQFIIIGEGEIRAELEKQISENNLQEKVILAGFVDNAAKYLKAFDLFVLPSRSEAMALVVLEAGLANIPVITTRVGGLPEIISDENFGKIVEPENENALSIAIINAIKNESWRKDSAENLHKRVKENFSHSQMLEKTLKIYGF